MVAATAPQQAPKDPCLIPASAGFTGLENQLYRVEIHDPGAALNAATSAPGTGAVTLPAGNAPKNQIVVQGGNWATGDVVEIYPSQATSPKMKGQLARIISVNNTTLALNIPVAGFIDTEAPRLRKIGGATWKWSRDNGSVVTRIEKINGNKITVSSLGPDKNLGFGRDAWVEILDDALELEGKPGQLAQIDDVDEATRIITLKSAPSSLVPAGFSLANFPNGIVPARNPKLRRWEGIGAVKFVSDPALNWLPLENGVQVNFAPNGDYRTGHYWQIPARSATAQSPTGDIEWPLDQAGVRVSLPAFGIKHHFCRLGIVTVKSDGSIDSTDCRCLWPALTAVPRLFFVSGDGQEAMPDLTQSGGFYKLPRPLVVGVANAHCLKQPGTVRFTVTSGNGRVVAEGDVPSANVVKLGTDAAGLASCDFHLDGTNYSQQVTATLLDVNGQAVSLPVIFNATLSLASQVACNPEACPDLQKAGVRTVQHAIDVLCKAGHKGCCVTVGQGGEFENLTDAVVALAGKKTSEICICLLPGDHRLSQIFIISKAPNVLRHLHIHGCGRGSRILLGQTLAIRSLDSVALQDLCIFADAPGDNHSVAIDNCRDVVITGCHLRQRGARNDWVTIREAGRIEIASNIIESTFERIFTQGDPTGPTGDIGPAEEKVAPIDVKSIADATAANLAERPKSERTAFLKEFRKIVKDTPGNDPKKKSLSAALKRLSASPRRKQRSSRTVNDPTLAAAIETPQALAESLIAAELGPFSLRVPALVIADAKADTAIINNVIQSEVRLYGTTGACTQGEFDEIASLFGSGMVVNNPVHTLRVEGNTLTKLVVDKNINGAITRPSPQMTHASLGFATGLFARVSILDNTFMAAGSQWLGGHLLSNGNHFIQTVAGQNLRVATAAGAAFICIGTSCNAPAQLRRAVPPANFSESANLLTFVQ